jgi:ABC-type arginine transport system permease subunit
MRPNPKARRRSTPIFRAVVEIVFIVFLFYSNLLMGEFSASSGQGKTLAFALNDIFTATNFVIAIIAASIGYLVFEFLRRKL